MSDAIDAAAWAIFDEHCARLGLRNMPWHQQDDAHRDEFMAYARAAIAAYRDREIETLRAQVAELNEARNYAARLFKALAPQCEVLDTVPGLLTQIDNWCAGAKSDLTDCQAVIRSRGHSGTCSHFAECVACGKPQHNFAHHHIAERMADHAFIPGPCSDACGHDRTTGEKA